MSSKPGRNSVRTTGLQGCGPDGSGAMTEGTWYFVSARTWGGITAVAAMTAAVTADAYAEDSWWLGVAVFVTVGLALHTLVVTRAIPWIPGVAALVAMVQWVLAPWVAYHIAPIVPSFAMPLPAEMYFRYAVPAVLALALGLYLPLWRTGRHPLSAQRARVTVPKSFRLTCDLMVAGGLAASAALAHGTPAALDYAVRLVSDLAFVGAFGLLLARVPGWGWRLAAVLIMRAALASLDGMFHDVLIWTAYAGAVAAFTYRLRPVTLAALAVAAIVAMGALNEIKGEYRAALAANPDRALDGRVQLLGATLGDQLHDPTAPFTGDARARTIARLNQGLIIAHILAWVPTSEPFADGETVRAALWNAVVPRVLEVPKYEAGGTYFERFTGTPLPRATSMNLSVAGEMYANYGPTGGWIGVFAVGTTIGLLFLVFASRARWSPLWYAWAPYVLLYAVQAENGLGEEINQIAKSLLIMAAFVMTVPAWAASSRRWARRLGGGYSAPALGATHA